jgi:integrase
MISKLCCVRRKADVHFDQRVKPKTLEVYKKHLHEFTQWLESLEISPTGAEAWDDALVDFKNDACLSRSKLSTTIAAVEFFFPRFKRQLVYSRAVSQGLTAASPIKHKVPMIKSVGVLFGTHFAGQGRPKMGVGLLLQISVGLRPSELLGLKREHVLIISEGERIMIFRLGALVGTKVRREQSVTLREAEDPVVYELVVRVIMVTLAGAFLFPYCYHAYNRAFKTVELDLGLKVGFTPHSPRAGFASERIALGEPESQVQRKGRWLMQSSFAVYADVITASQVSTTLHFVGLREAMVYCNAHVLDYFSLAVLGAEVHGRARTSAVAAASHSSEALQHSWPRNVGNSQARPTQRLASVEATVKGRGKGASRGLRNLGERGRGTGNRIEQPSRPSVSSLVAKVQRAAPQPKANRQAESVLVETLAVGKGAKGR